MPELRVVVNEEAEPADARCPRHSRKAEALDGKGCKHHADQKLQRSSDERNGHSPMASGGTHKTVIRIADDVEEENDLEVRCAGGKAFRFGCVHKQAQGIRRNEVHDHGEDKTQSDHELEADLNGLLYPVSLPGS